MKVKGPQLQPVRYPAYHAVAELNRSFEQTIDSLEHLTGFTFFRRDQLRYYQVMLEEMRSLVNHELSEIINQRELDSSRCYEKLRLEYEKSKKDPNDILLEAKRHRQHLRKQKGTTNRKTPKQITR
jgi:hypothetical protein